MAAAVSMARVARPVRLTQRCERELLGYFRSDGSSIGFGAQRYDFDEPKSGVVDTGARIVAAFRASPASIANAHTGHRLAHVDRDDRELLRDAYTPRGCPPELRAALTLSGGRYEVCLIGLVSRSRVAMAQRDKRRPAESVMEFLRWSVGNHRLMASVRVELTRLLDGALGRFVEVCEP